jgi:hypothetical protein
MIVMIDNYDSFTYNIVQYLGELGREVQVFRNDEISVDEIAALQPESIVISPGPCTPNEAGISLGTHHYLAFVWVIKVLGKCSAVKWFERERSCMVKRPRFSTPELVSLGISRVRLLQLATTRSWWTNTVCPIVSKSLLGQKWMGR